MASGEQGHPADDVLEEHNQQQIIINKTFSNDLFKCISPNILERKNEKKKIISLQGDDESSSQY